jgi:hypothetical protein
MSTETDALRYKGKKLADELNDINKQIALIERACIPHDWNIPQSETYAKFIEVEDGIEARGSDVWVKTRMVDTQKTRWKRKCRKCGKTEYSEELGMPKNIPQVPIFPGE